MANPSKSLQQQFKTWLIQQPPETLVSLLLQVAQRDDQLAQMLLVKSTPADGQDTLMDDLYGLIDEVTTVHGFVDWRAVHSFVAPLDQAVDTLETLLTPEHSAALVELAQYAIEQTEAALEEVDDSGGLIGDTLCRLGELHLKACKMAHPNVETLAHDLFELETTLPFGVCSFSASTYRDVLGKAGLQHYRALAQVQWDKLGSAAPDEGFDTNRFKITHVMEQLAQASGDVDELVAIKSRSLRGAYDYLEIAEILAKADRHDEAMQWAERGLTADTARPDNRLRDFLVAVYLKSKRFDEALQLTWVQFAEQPGLTPYQKLHTVATQLGVWPAQRTRALAWLESEVAGEAAQTSRFKPKPSVPDTSRRLDIALWEKDLSAAWAAVQAGQCQQHLRIRLAQTLAATRPADAISLYRQVVPEIVGQTNNNAYASAIELIGQMRPLMLGLGQTVPWQTYLAELRTTFKPKRNFIKLLDGVKR